MQTKKEEAATVEVTKVPKLGALLPVNTAGSWGGGAASDLSCHRGGPGQHVTLQEICHLVSWVQQASVH